MNIHEYIHMYVYAHLCMALAEMRMVVDMMYMPCTTFCAHCFAKSQKIRKTVKFLRSLFCEESEDQISRELCAQLYRYTDILLYS